MSHRTHLSIRRILEASAPPRDISLKLETQGNVERNSLFHMVQTAYNACMDTAAIETLGSHPLLTLLQELNGLYPANPPEFTHSESSKWLLDNETEISRTLDFLMGIGVNPLMAFKLDVCFGYLFRYLLAKRISLGR